MKTEELKILLEEKIKDKNKILVVCGAGFSAPYGIQPFNGTNGIGTDLEFGKKLIRGLVDKYHSQAVYYSVEAPYDTPILTLNNTITGRGISYPITKLLTNGTLYNMPEIFYNLLGNMFDEDDKEDVLTTTRANPDELIGLHYIYILKALQEKCFKENKDLSVITLNIDDLMEENGIKVNHLHGSLDSSRCNVCGKQHGKIKYITKEKFNGLDWETTDEFINNYRCECGGLIRPNVTLLDEEENQGEVNNLLSKIRTADLIISIGLNQDNFTSRRIRTERKLNSRLIVINENNIKEQ